MKPILWIALFSAVSISALGQVNPPSTEQDSDDKWQKVESGGREAYVKTNGFYYTKPQYSGSGFHTFIVTNLPESDVVGAPQSVINDVEGHCEARTYHLLGSLFYAGKNRSGLPMQQLPAEEVERKVAPNSLFEKAFDLLCKIAQEQK